jgi:hypothetical protein
MMDDKEDILTKRFQTTMIGALYQFEQAFGYLWGFDKEEEDITDLEYDFREKWENTRYNILNNGNNQLRLAIKDIQQIKYDEKRKYSYNYRFNNPKKD